MANSLQQWETKARWLVVIAAAVGECIAAWGYLARHNGIDGTAGALLVVASTIAVLLASFILALGWPKRSVWRRLLSFLVVLGIIGTGKAAYFLEAHWLLAAMAVALAGWLFGGTWKPAATAMRASPTAAMIAIAVLLLPTVPIGVAHAQDPSQVWD